MGFGLDVKAKDYRDDETDKVCFSCGRPIPRGVECAGCWHAADGAGYEEGGEG
jgi:hypothetical protein